MAIEELDNLTGEKEKYLMIFNHVLSFDSDNKAAL